MKITELDFLDNLVKTARITGGVGGFDEMKRLLDEQYKSTTGAVVGQLNAAFSATATATNQALITVTPIQDPPSGGAPVVGPVRISFSYRANGLATTPGG